jgi:hypothetical protein
MVESRGLANRRQVWIVGFWQRTATALGASALFAMGLAAGCSGPRNFDDDGGTIPTADAGSCGVRQMLCGGACADVKKDHGNCGACGTACKVGELCSQGTYAQGY